MQNTEVHRKVQKINEQKLPAKDPDEKHTDYIVCSTVRSGSALLCKTLSQSGLGQPEEYFHKHRIRQLKLEGRPEAFADYCRALVDGARCGKGAFGMKLHWWQLQDFLRLARGLSVYAGLGDREILDRFFPNAKYVYLRRQDVVAQAVSAAIAAQTGQWESLQRRPSDTRKTAPTRERTIKFQPWRIYEWEKSLLKQNQDWVNFFQVNQLDYLEVVYEDLVCSFPETIAELIGYISGESSLLVNVEMPTRRQSNTVNRRFIQRYRRFPKSVMAVLYWLYGKLRPQQLGGGA
ncbi:MAG: Stf0 family sulfotransferase [Cyanobacteria bacterium J06623_5]